MSEANAVLEQGPITPLQGTTGRQVEAVYAVMRLLRDDKGSGTEQAQVICDACHRLRESRGSVTYETFRLCNGCATDFELLRVAHAVLGIDEYLNR